MLNEGKSRQVLLSVLGVAILVVAVVGISYAAFTVGGTANTNTISTATITMAYAQPTNGIYINNALPMDETAGKGQNTCTSSTDCTVFDFTVTASASAAVNIPYTISVTEVSGNTIPDANVRVYLTNMNGDADTEIVYDTVDHLTAYTGHSRTNSYTLTTGTYAVVAGTPTVNEYRLRMWLDADYVPPTGTAAVYKLLVNVDADATPLS